MLSGEAGLQYAWFVWSMILFVVWAVVFVSLRDAEARREMLVVSAATSLFGLTEPIFVPAYWTPPSLFDLAARTGFDIESVIFSFGIGGLAVALYESARATRGHEPVPGGERMSPRHRLHVWALVSAPVTFGIVYPLTFWWLNPIYTASFALLVGGAFSSYCRPDLVRKMAGSALLFVGLYFVYFLSLTLVFPDYVEVVWNLEALSGLLVLGVPVEELAFAAAFGFQWSSTYEHVMWLRPIGRRSRPAERARGAVS